VGGCLQTFDVATLLMGLATSGERADTLGILAQDYLQATLKDRAGKISHWHQNYGPEPTILSQLGSETLARIELFVTEVIPAEKQVTS
jgi:hypothetical protein